MQEEPSYANTNIQVEPTRADTEPDHRWRAEEHRQAGRPLRAQSVQPLQEHLTGKANFHAKRFNTSYRSPRSERWVYKENRMLIVRFHIC